MRKKHEKISAFLMVLLLLGAFTPFSGEASSVPLTQAGMEQAAYIRYIDVDGDGIADEYVYCDDNGKVINHIVIDDGAQAFGDSTLTEENSPVKPPTYQPPTSFVAIGALALSGDEPLKHVPVDPIPVDYGGNTGDTSPAFYPTYGEWVYEPLSATEAALIGYLGTATEITIPEKVGDYTVITLSPRLFSRQPPYLRNMSYGINNQQAQRITSVTVPNTIRNVQAFLDRTSVQSIDLPDSVMVINNLGQGSKLSAINVSSNNSSFTSVDGVLYDKNVTRFIAYPPEKKDSVVTLPSTLTQVQANSFASCQYVEAFAVDPANGYFSARDGVLYDKDGSILIKYPMNKGTDTYISPAGVATIGSGAFDDTLKLKHIILSEGVENMVYTISNNVIETLSLPSTLVRTDRPGNFTIFYQMFNLVSVDVSPGNPVLSSSGGVLYDKNYSTLYVYPLKKPGTEYIMPDTLTTVTVNSFWTGGNSLQKVTLSDSLTDYNELSERSPWSEFAVSEGNACYTAIDGVLYTKDGRVMVAYPLRKQDTAFSVQDSVEYINTINANALRTLTLPVNLKIMGNPGIELTRNPLFNVIGRNNYARRWANYFGIAFNRTDVTAEEILAAMEDASDIISNLDTITHEAFAGGNLEKLTNLIENYESMSQEEQVRLGPAKAAELDSIRNRVGELNHNDENVSIISSAWNIRVDATERNASDDAYNTVQDLLDEGLRINVLYDVRLTRNGMNYSLPAGQTMTVTIRGNFAGLTADMVRIFHLKQDYTVEYIMPLMITNTEITFVTSSFSLFGVVKSATGDLMPGDVTGDGKIDMQDVLLIYQCFRGRTILTSEQWQAADVNNDGAVDMQDVLLVYQYFRGRISSFGN